MLLLRHLPTRANLDGVFMGQSDYPIAHTDNSINYAGITLKNDLTVFCSPLRRCTQTVCILADRLAKEHLQESGLEMLLITRKELMERHLGEFQGKRKKPIHDEYVEQVKNGRLNPLFTPPGGEALPVFKTRIETFYGELNKYCATKPDKQVVVCSHVQVLRMLTCLHYQLKIEQSWLSLNYENGTLVEL